LNLSSFSVNIQFAQNFTGFSSSSPHPEFTETFLNTFNSSGTLRTVVVGPPLPDCDLVNISQLNSKGDHFVLNRASYYCTPGQIVRLEKLYYAPIITFVVSCVIWLITFYFKRDRTILFHLFFALLTASIIVSFIADYRIAANTARRCQNYGWCDSFHDIQFVQEFTIPYIAVFFFLLTVFVWIHIAIFVLHRPKDTTCFTFNCNARCKGASYNLFWSFFLLGIDMGVWAPIAASEINHGASHISVALILLFYWVPWWVLFASPPLVIFFILSCRCCPCGGLLSCYASQLDDEDFESQGCCYYAVAEEITQVEMFTPVSRV